MTHKKLRRKVLDVLGVIAKGKSLETKGGDAMEQVQSKLMPSHHDLQVPMGSGHQSKIHGSALLAALVISVVGALGHMVID